MSNDKYLGMRLGDLDNKPYAKYWNPGTCRLRPASPDWMTGKYSVPDTLGRDMFVHCATEMNHLASFLPELYADYH